MYVINLDEDETMDRDQMATMAFLKNPKNRFSDKSYQMIACKNGNIGSNVEHSPFDGMVSTTVILYSLDKQKQINLDLAEIATKFEIRADLEAVEELEFNYDLKIEIEIQKAAKLFQEHAENVEIASVVLNNCDKNTLKSYKINPDTFSQMCMQLAYYQLHDK